MVNKKEILKREICTRLPYNVKCKTKADGIYTVTGVNHYLNRVYLDCPVYCKGDDEWTLESIVLCLRPMSSMSQQEAEEYHSLCYSEYVPNGWHYHNTQDSIEWLNKKHFDYNRYYDEEKQTSLSLIDLGLAVEVSCD